MKHLTENVEKPMISTPCRSGGMADAGDLKSLGLMAVLVRVRSPAPDNDNPNQIFLIGDGFGLLVYFDKGEDVFFRNGVPR